MGGKVEVAKVAEEVAVKVGAVVVLEKVVESHQKVEAVVQEWW